MGGWKRERKGAGEEATDEERRFEEMRSYLNRSAKSSERLGNSGVSHCLKVCFLREILERETRRMERRTCNLWARGGGSHCWISWMSPSVSTYSPGNLSGLSPDSRELLADDTRGRERRYLEDIVLGDVDLRRLAEPCTAPRYELKEILYTLSKREKERRERKKVRKRLL